MSIFNVIDPNAFQTTVMAWIGVLTVIAGALSGFIALIISYYLKIKAASQETKSEINSKRLDGQSAKIESLRSDVTNVALAVPAVIDAVKTTNGGKV